MSSLNLRRTIADIIAAPLKQNGLGDNPAERVVEALRRVDCRRVSSRYRHEPSGGQRHRCRYRAAASPKFVLADEIVSADVSTQAQILTLLETGRRDASPSPSSATIFR